MVREGDGEDSNLRLDVDLIDSGYTDLWLTDGDSGFTWGHSRWRSIVITW